MPKHIMILSADGDTTWCLHNDEREEELNASSILTEAKRASDVRFEPTTKTWTVDMSPVGETTLEGFDRRKAGINAEIDFLNDRMIQDPTFLPRVFADRP